MKTKMNLQILSLIILLSANSGLIDAMENNQPQQPSKDENSRALEGNYKFGKCLAMWGITAAAIGGARWLNNQTGNVINPATMDNACGVAFLSGFLGGVDFIADKDVKTVTEQTILRVPTIMLVHWLTASQTGIKILMNCPVLKDFIGYQQDPHNPAQNNLGECRIRAATLGTLFYVTAIRPGLDKAWAYGKEKVWEAKDWVIGATGFNN